jgi:hypothetical protein
VSSIWESSLAPDYSFVSVKTKNALGMKLGLHGFGDFVTVEKADFAFKKILNLTFTKQKKLCFKCMVDLPQILLFLLLQLSVIILV